jgi:3-methyl-2-oxobutanoate hydroxymethyltransferase
MPVNMTFIIRKCYETDHHLPAAEMQTGKKRFATITAYDYSFAKLFADEGINVMLVGDSLG